MYTCIQKPNVRYMLCSPIMVNVKLVRVLTIIGEQSIYLTFGFCIHVYIICLHTKIIHNTQHAVLAEMPLTTHPLQWVEPPSLACTLPPYT